MKKENSRPLTDDQKTDEFIYKKLAEAADSYEQQLNADPSLDHVRLTDEMREDMMRRIAALEASKAGKASGEDALPEKNVPSEEDALPERNIRSGEDALSEEDKRALEIGRKAMHVRRHAKLFRGVGIAAVLLLGLFGLSMTSHANRLWLLNLWNQMTGKESVLKTRNWDEVENYDTGMEEVYADILEKIGIRTVYFDYIPEGLIFDDYVIYDELNVAKLFYKYKDTILNINMEKQMDRTTSGMMVDGNVLETIEVETSFYETATVMKIQGPEDEIDYVAELTHDNCKYTISGILPQEEFLEMIKKIQIY